MVLIRGRAAVAAAALVTLAALAGCNQSLFDNHGSPGDARGAPGGDDGGSDGPAVPSSCPADCIGDAAANYDGTPTGSNGRWRYLEDLGHQAWLPMTPGSGGMVGQDPANHITTCQAHDAPACAQLPGALLVSAAGASDTDPAIELTAPASQVLQLSLRAYLPAGADQTIRVYRNSREDLLLGVPLPPAALVERAIVLDALAGDRFLVAISGGLAASDIALELYVNATGEHFPRDCRLATPAMGLTPTTLADRCGGSTLTHFAYDTVGRSVSPAPTQLGAGPFPELAPAITVARSHELLRDLGHVVDWSHDVTVQLWVKLRALYGTSPSFAFSDFDIDQCAGIDLFLDNGIASSPEITLGACTDPSALTAGQTTAPYPAPLAWHFVRVVRTSSQFALCVDGQAAITTLAAPLDRNPTSNPVNVGNNNAATPVDMYFDGQIADLRVIGAALPCQ